MPPLIYVDGAATPAAEAVVPVTDRGFLYGDTVFETLRVYAGVPHLLGDHLARLRASAEQLGIDISLTTAALASEVYSAVTASGEAEAVVRITVSRGDGSPGIDPRSASRSRRIVHVSPLASRLAGGGPSPVAVRLVPARRGAELAPAAKIGAYVDAILALRIAHAAGDDDAVFTDSNGLVLEATTANVFVVTPSGDLRTPPTARIFPGITRREILRTATELGIRSEVREIEATELGSAAEAFLTSSVREVVPISRIDGASVRAPIPGPITERLHLAYRAGILGRQPGSAGR